jgi:alpha-tubulin suppressor-like RCC1 family protein
MVLCEIFAGGGHSGALTWDGRLYLFGWNESGQLGSSGVVDDSSSGGAAPCCQKAAGIVAEKAALGFSNTLVIEKDTRMLLALGDNSRGQVSGPQTTTLRCRK